MTADPLNPDPTNQPHVISIMRVIVVAEMEVAVPANVASEKRPGERDG